MQSKNPFIDTIHTADPSAHVWEDGRLYVYPSHDLDPARGCDYMDRYHVYSTEDMVHWRDEGEILSSRAYSDDIPWGREEGGFMWAPDCAYKNGTYYFYYPHPSEPKWNDSWKIGVAVSKHPAKDFKDIGYIEGMGGEFMIDPCVFVDDNGRAYMYYGGGSQDDRCLGGEMNEDMISLKSGLQIMEGLKDFHEATWVFKREGVYYLVYSDNYWVENGEERYGANKMRYATSDKPLGPWTYRGIFLDSVGDDNAHCGTTHGSVVEYKGQWYMFYHNAKISGRGNLRSICVDLLYFNEDGSIKMVKQTTVGGVPPVGPAPLENPDKKTYTIEDCTVSNGAVIENNAVRNLQAEGACIRFVNIDGSKGGRATISIYHSVPKELAKLRLAVNDIDYSLLNCMPAKDAESFTGRAYITVNLKPGKTNTITLTGGNGEVNIKYITIDSFND